MTINKKLIGFTLFLVGITVLAKFYLGPQPDWSGFSPVIAIALFSGMIIKEKNMSFLMPLLALFISDLVIQFLYKQGLFDYAGFFPGQWKYYVMLLASTLIGWLLKGRNAVSLLAGAFAAPTVFFLLSNFTVWALGDGVTYTRDTTGLLNCLAAGIPFYLRSLAATILLLPVIIVSYNYIMKQRTSILLA